MRPANRFPRLTVKTPRFAGLSGSQWRRWESNPRKVSPVCFLDVCGNCGLERWLCGCGPTERAA